MPGPTSFASAAAPATVVARDFSVGDVEATPGLALGGTSFALDAKPSDSYGPSVTGWDDH
jgi:hypothetical protein